MIIYHVGGKVTRTQTRVLVYNKHNTYINMLSDFLKYMFSSILVSDLSNDRIDLIMMCVCRFSFESVYTISNQ